TGDAALRALARAGLAQAHAMRMIPKLPDRPDFADVQRHFDAAMDLAGAVVRELPRRRRRPPAPGRETPASAREIEWMALNARGMALMYSSDYLPAPDAPKWRSQRAAALRRAIDQLQRADRVSPNNWANDCDRASATMRLAYYERSAALFDA